MNARSSRPPASRPVPLSPFAAVLWTIGTTAIFIYLVVLMESVRKGAAADLVSSVGCQAVAYLSAIFLMLRLHAPSTSVRAFLSLRPATAATYPLALLLGAALAIPINALYDVIERAYPTKSDDSLLELFRSATTAQRIGFVVVITLVGPLLEEVFFRGALFNVQDNAREGRAADDTPRRATSPVFVIALSAALFALAHMEWQKFLPLGIVGLILGFLRHNSGSILPSFLLHAAFNAVPCYFMITAGPATNQPEQEAPRWLIASTLAGSLALLSAIHLIGARAARRAQELERP